VSASLQTKVYSS